MPIVNRRSFINRIGSGILAAPALWIASRATASTPGLMGKSRVVIARREGMLSPSNTLDETLTRKMLDAAALAFTGGKEADALWRTLFSSKDTVAIKVNTLGGRSLSPHPELVYAVAEKLADVGVLPQRIFIWDRSVRELERAVFTKESAKGRAAVIATDSPGVGYEAEPETSGSIGSCFSRIVSQGCTALINIGILKDHDLCGVSVAMKNFFGAIHNPNKYHFDVAKDPYVPDVCLHPYIRNRLRLTICDAFRGQCDGGPAYKASAAWDYNGLMIAADPVALDAVAASILEKKRAEMKLPPLKEAGREPLYIQLAEEKKLGWADPAHIEIVEAAV
ncbi:MAG: DUF362 domain-containing protein [Candidatus Omnitrophota bacterium]